MAYTAPRTWSDGELVTAAIGNVHWRDNQIAMYAGGMSIASQAANEILFATSATQLGRNSGFKFDGTTLTLPGQIAFPATQAASSGANVLDDYEESTSFVPTDVSGAALTLSVATCSYTKIGQRVNAEIRVSYPATGDTSVAKIAVPFTCGGTAGGGYFRYTDYGAGIMVLVVENTAAAQFYTLAGVAITNANLTGKDLRFAVSYRASA